jgi:ribosome-binding factor A
MKKTKTKSKETLGPTNRQLRAGENIRHVLVQIIARGEIHDPNLKGISITVGEVRMSPDLKHANVFVSALGEQDPEPIAKALNHAAAFLRGQMARELDAKFTPKLRFIPDKSYDVALKIDSLLANPRVQQDLERKHFTLDEDEEF